MSHIERTLRSCRELGALCTRDGWIDEDTLHYQILQRSDREVLVLVQFEEVVTENSGYRSRRIARGGQVRLHLDHYGEVVRVQVI
jgi:hypothetical protein